MRVAFACVKKCVYMHHHYIKRVYKHCVCKCMQCFLPYLRSCWLKFSNMAPMMALQLYSEDRRFSDYSNHMTIIYLRQIGIYETFKTFKSSFRLFPFPHQPLNWLLSVIGLATPLLFIYSPALHFTFAQNSKWGRMSLVTRVGLVYIALNNVKRPCPCYHLHQRFPSSYVRFVSQSSHRLDRVVTFREWSIFEVYKLTPANNM